MRRFHLQTVTWYLTLFLGAIISWYIIQKNIDPDLWWRMRHGNDLLASGFTTGDPYSFTMPSFPFVSHAWSLDILFAKLNQIGGYALTSTLAVVSTTLLIAIITQKVQERWLGTLTVLFLWGSLISFMGVRAQVFAWILITATLYLCFSQQQVWDRWKWYLPLLFLVWANIHGSFPIGLLLIGLRMLIDAVTSRTFEIKTWALLLVSTAITLLNPYGLGLWREIWLTNTDASLRTSISEWIPIWNKTSTTLLLVSLSAGTSIMLAVLKKHWSALSFVLVTTLLGLSSVRHIPLFALTASITILSLAPTVDFRHFFKTIQSDRVLRTLVSVLITLATLLLLWAPLDTLIFRSEGVYPTAAVVHIQENYPDAKLLNHYDFGGFLIWMRPESKVFIDGRMPSWRWNAPTGELDNAHKTWKEIGEGNSELFKETVAQFSIDTILWHKPTPTNIKFFTMLKEAGWEVAYVDEISVVYRGPVSLEQSPTPLL